MFFCSSQRTTSCHVENSCNFAAYFDCESIKKNRFKKMKMKNCANFFRLATILLIFSTLLISCKNKDKNGDTTPTPEQELQVASADGFSATHEFPNDQFVPTKEFLPNDDILLHKEILLKGNVPDANSLYDITLYVDYYTNIDIDNLPLVITAISPDSTSKRTQTYRVSFRENTGDKSIAKEEGRELMRHSKMCFPSMSFPTAGMATFKVELNAPGGKFYINGIKAISVKAEKAKPEA